MNPRIALMMGVTALLGTGLAAADEISPELRVAARHVAVTVCASCHGPQGRSISPKFPNLAGQHPAYLVAQLNNFKAHTRGDPDALGYMWGMAAPLDDDLIGALAAYYGAQRPAGGRSPDAAATARGKEIYANGVAADGIPPCGACHGPAAAGTDQYPRLAGQSTEYLLKQLRSFQSNLRNVAVMHGVASGLKTSEMTDVAAYLQSLGP